MKKSESIAKLASALAKVQGQLQPAAKNASNPFFKSEYADLGSVVESARDLMAANGLSVSQFPGASIARESGGYSATLTTIMMHESGEWLEQELTIPLAKVDPQGYGSAITYARRYALAAALGIVTGDDDDGNAASQRQNGASSKPPPSQDISPPKPPPAMVKKFHALGAQIYGDEWDDKRPELVKAITDKRDNGQAVTSSKELYRAEMAYLIDGMNKKLTEAN